MIFVISSDEHSHLKWKMAFEFHRSLNYHFTHMLNDYMGIFKFITSIGQYPGINVCQYLWLLVSAVLMG